MRRYTLFLVVFVFILVLSSIVITQFPGQDSSLKQADNVLQLTRPLFVLSAKAANSEIGAYLDSEAGISAYFQDIGGINLDDVRSLYKTIEIETADYIIGSIAVPDYPETDDAHVYIHVDGWVLSYYLQEDPASKIFDWIPYDGVNINSNKLLNVLGVVASVIGSPLSGVEYYDFRYPNATNIMVIAEKNPHSTGSDSFEVTLPSTYGYSQYM